MQPTASSAEALATRRGVLLAHDSRPFHCVRGHAHRWGLTERTFSLVIDAAVIDHGHWTEDRCKRCVDKRAVGFAA